MEFSDALEASNPQPERKKKSRKKSSRKPETGPQEQVTGSTEPEEEPSSQTKKATIEFVKDENEESPSFGEFEAKPDAPPPLGSLAQTAALRNNSMHRRRKSVGGINGLSEVSTYWYDVLTRYGGMETDEATRVCILFEKANLPFPSPDADAYLTHEFLSSIGIIDPGDRCRVLLACKRMPELRRKHRQHDDEPDNEKTEVDEVEKKRKSLLEASLFCGDVGVDAGLTSYEADTTVVQLTRFQPKDGSFEWIDFVGKDVPDLDSIDQEGQLPANSNVSKEIGTQARKLSRAERRESKSVSSTNGEIVAEQTPRSGHIALDIIHRERSKRRASSQPSENANNTLFPPPVGPSSSIGNLSPTEALGPSFPSGNLGESSRREQESSSLDGSRWAAAMREVFKATGEHDPNELLLPKENVDCVSPEGMITVSPAEEDDVQKSTLLADLLATKLPLPQLRIDRSQPSKCCFVLRVCTLDVEDEDDTMRSLTNRWTIFVDAANKTVVTIHRVDSVALATLRDSWKQGIPGNISFNEFIVKLLERFLLEYEKALDASDEWLDSCEASMLSSTSGSNDDLLTNLFHLQRRASVYDRMVVLSRNLLQREVAKHLMLGDDLESLESRFQQLQEKTVELGSRAQNLLEIHLSLTGYHTNELMKLLTKVSMFFTPITFLAGLWGMNFQNMPELQWEYGYWCALGLMVCIAMGMLGWFRYAKI